MSLLLIILLLLLSFLFLLFFLPFPGKFGHQVKYPVDRFDEADSVLTRRRLAPGSEHYKNYYKSHPQFKEPDDRAREAPGLLSRESRYFEPSSFASADANFMLIDHLGKLAEGVPSKIKTETDPLPVSNFLETWLKKNGAHSVGFTKLKPHHQYSHRGRSLKIGEPVNNDHTFALAITVEMDIRMMQSAPAGPTVMESSEQYLRSGVLALKAAAYIRNLGYEATAHIDGNYEVICPLVAADAGLGVIGRMGLLMTPRLGPRVRIAAVTTTMSMILSTNIPDTTAIDFCGLCKKCAQVCPSNAIPNGDMESVDGISRWRINSEKCYHYWTICGTDCGRCVVSCPYSHPDNPFHRFIRWGIKNNLLFRRLAVKLDDVFYGLKPSIRSVPDWIKVRSDQ